ncbi:phage major capsid protein [Mycobacterium sp. pW049]|uniref:phage major capsid protein n=1 Tax=[Mycobacterium] bulgaricum TaxID=3238985 RepID=UPI00351B3153
MLDRLKQLQELRANAVTARKAITDKVQRESRAKLTNAETATFAKLTAKVKDLDAQIADHKDEMRRAGYGDPLAEFVAAASARAAYVADGGGMDRTSWAARAATSLAALGVGENRGVVSGSINAPALVSPAVTPKSRPERLIDLLVNRMTLDYSNFEYLRQTLRGNNAAPVADLATKPTSVFTLTPVADRARVIAHLSESYPVRYVQDYADVIQFLEVEMAEGVLAALESQVINGSGTGENLTGVLNVSGTTQVAFATDVPTTLRKSITALQNIGVRPNAICLNPSDAEDLDLLKEGAGGVGFLLDGFQNGTAASGNVLGDSAMINRVISPSVPAGQAIVADWNAIRLYVREDLRIDVDVSGTLFDTNAAKMRAEMRVGLGHLHPASFAIADLTA